MTESRRQSLWSRVRLSASIVRYSNAHNRDFAREHYAFFADLQAYLQERIGSLGGLRVLDVGCGKSFWLTLLLHSCGARVTGVDTEFVSAGRGPGKYVAIARSSGLERALRTLVWDLLYAAPYYRELAAVCPFPLRFAGVDVRCMDVTRPEFAAGTFDLVVSHEVFEHVADVDAALGALRRLLKPGGLTYICVHNYASLSGGHHIAWKYPDTEQSRVVPPWDHLRENRYPDIPSWINRLRERDYRRAFDEQFEVLDWFPTAREGEALLTEEVRAELADYSDKELLTKGFVVVARPKGERGVL